MKALYVGRDAAFERLLETLLAWEGHELTAARTAEEALGGQREAPCDFIVLDLEALGREGRGILRALGALDGGRGPFFLLLTTPEEVGTLPAYIEVGAQHFAVKPVDAKLLMVHVARASRWVRDRSYRHETKATQAAAVMETLQRVDRGLRALKAANAAIVGASDEASLLQEICRAIVREAGYRMAWVGFALEDEAKTVQPVAAEGIEEGYLETARVSWSEATARGRGPTGRCIREGRAVSAKNIPTDPAMAPWREQAMARGYASSIALPLESRGRVFGALTIYAVEPEMFDLDEVSLLEAVASDLSFGIVSRRAIEERDLAARQMASTDRLTSMGMLAAGVAHELNNPLAYVVSNVDFALKMLERGGFLEGEKFAEVVEALREAGHGTERLKTVVQDIKTFSRVESESKGPIDVQQVLEASIRMAWSAIRWRAKLVKELEAVPPVDAAPQRLGQVFLNVLVNAAQAVPEGNSAGNEIRISLKEDPQGHVAIEVADTGCGIPPENLARVFEPFFTTKPPSVGTGLGLPICREIVRGMGGEITLESKVGLGTTCRIVLPQAPKTRSAIEDRAPKAPSTKRRGKVLIIDDEPMVGRALERILKREHEVRVLDDAREALALIRNGADFDVILSDCMMPGMTGMELFREIERTHPTVARRMVFLTGMGITDQAKGFFEGIPNPRIEKPFSPSAVREIVWQLVG